MSHTSGLGMILSRGSRPAPRRTLQVNLISSLENKKPQDRKILRFGDLIKLIINLD